MRETCPMCAMRLGNDGDCNLGHRASSERFRSSLQDTLRVLGQTAADLRSLALRMDSRGELLAQQVHDQARRAEQRIARIRELLTRQPVWGTDE